jgi:hypothetical protein
MTAVLDAPLTPCYVDSKAKKRTRETQVMLEEAAFMRSIGLPWHQIADRLGVQEASLRKAVRLAAAEGIVIE